MRDPASMNNAESDLGMWLTSASGCLTSLPMPTYIREYTSTEAHFKKKAETRTKTKRISLRGLNYFQKFCNPRINNLFIYF